MGIVAPRVGVCIVSYNSARVLPGCLRSLRAQGPAVALTTIVVDNGSRDDTRALVRRDFPEVRLIEAPRNGGFSYGNNLALEALGVGGWGIGVGDYSPPLPLGEGGGEGRPAQLAPDALTLTLSQGEREQFDSQGEREQFDCVLYLNPDTEVPAGTIAALVRVMAARPRVGGLSPRLVRADGSLDKACHRGFPTPWNALCRFLGLDTRWPRSRLFGGYNLTYLPEDWSTPVDAVAAAFLLVRAEAVRQVGAWDETFFAYGEDIDYCLRLRQAGWTIWYEAGVRALHLKGEASKQRSLPMLREFYRAMAVYYRKHHAAQHPLPLRLAIVGGIRALYTAALVRQLARPASKRWVGAARPVARH